MKLQIKIKRAYNDASEEDGYRVLVDKLWPRGLSKQVLHIDEWAKDIAPTPAIRTWFGHKPERWDEFQKQYRNELKDNAAINEFIKDHKKYPVITLVYAAKDEAYTHALVLQKFLTQKLNRK